MKDEDTKMSHPTIATRGARIVLTVSELAERAERDRVNVEKMKAATAAYLARIAAEKGTKETPVSNGKRGRPQGYTMTAEQQAAFDAKIEANRVKRERVASLISDHQSTLATFGTDDLPEAVREGLLIIERELLETLGVNSIGL